MAKVKELVLVLDNIRSLYNVGSMFRTADGLGVSKIYLCGYTGTPEQKGLKKVALGAEESVPWEKCGQAWRTVDRLRKDGYRVIGLECGVESEPLPEFQPGKKPIALVVGNEVTGLSQSLIRHMDGIVEIPMLGTKRSFNVSVAAAIALYRIRYCR